MSAARFAIGLLGLSIVAVSMLTCGVALRHRHLSQFAGARARLAELFLALAVLIGVLELLGSLRLFRAIPIVAACALAGAVAARGLPRALAGRPRARPHWTALIALAAGGAVLAEWLIPTLDSFAHGIRTFDTLWYHLPWAASYAQTGQVTSLRFTDVEYLTAFYPASAEMLHGLGIVMLGRDTLSPLVNLGWLGATLLAGWCVGVRRGLGAATTIAVACVLGSQMMVLSQAGSAANDVAGIFFLVTAVVFVVEEQGELAALAAGLAIATKLSLVAPALAVAVAGLPVARRSRWLALLLLGGGFWYARNLIAVGNPLPWVNLPGLATPARPLQSATGFSVAHYLTTPSAWSHFFWPGLHAGLGFAWIPFVLIALAGPLALAWRPGLRWLAAAALVSVLAYILTPEGAAGPAGHPTGFAFNLRYAAPAFTLCLLALGCIPRPRVTLPLLGGLLIAVLARASLWPARHAAVAVLIAVVVLGGGLSLLGLRPTPGSGRRQRVPAAALALASLLLVGGGLYALQRSYLRTRYRVTRVSQMSYVWDYFRGVHHARVGVVGTYGGFFAYPLSGLDLSNGLGYIGAHGRSGSFTPLRSCRAWRRALNAGHYDYAVLTPGRDPWHPNRLTRSPEAGWTLGDPHARVVLRHRGAGATIFVVRLSGRVDPGGCG